MTLDRSIQTILGVLPSIKGVREDLLDALREGNHDDLDSCQVELRNWVRSIKDDVPETCLSPFRELQRYVVFVERYFKQGQFKMMRSNAVSAGHALEKLRVCLVQSHPGLVGLGIDLKKVSSMPEKDLLDEAARCYGIGAYRGAIINAVSALEATLRSLATSHLSSRKAQPLYQVISKLEQKGHLRGQDEAILQLCRVFRNLVAHPSEFQPSEADARGLIAIAYQRLVG